MEVKPDHVEDLDDDDNDEKVISPLPEEYMWKKYFSEDDNFKSQIPEI